MRPTFTGATHRRCTARRTCSECGSPELQNSSTSQSSPTWGVCCACYPPHYGPCPGVGQRYSVGPANQGSAAMPISAISHVSLTVSDLEASKAWYADVLEW